MTELIDIIIVVGATGSGLVAGIFFTFSNFVMRALAQLPNDDGIAAMNAINVTVINPLFFLAFFGTGVVCLVAIAVVLFGTVEGPQSGYVIAGSVLYLFGCLLVTIAFNVPLNNRLATVAPGKSGATDIWNLYLSQWTRWNHVRTAASLAAAVLLILAL